MTDDSARLFPASEGQNESDQEDPDWEGCLTGKILGHEEGACKLAELNASRLGDLFEPVRHQPAPAQLNPKKLG